MKKSIILGFVFVSSICFGQKSNTQLNIAKAVIDPTVVKTIINAAVKDTNLYNTIWQYFIAQSQISDSNAKWHFFKDLNIKFKTFQSADSTKASIGFSYDLNAAKVKFIEREKTTMSHSFDVNTQGNVAFNKSVNPNNFLVSKIDYSFSHFLGGVKKIHDTPSLILERAIRFRLARIDNPHSNEAIKKWDSLGEIVKYKNMYGYSISPSIAFESNQDFSRMQLTPGINIGIGVKAWDNKNILAKLNVFDFPFALVRYVSGVDQSFTRYGAVIPVISLGLDHVVPTKDSVREKLVGNLNAYNRIRFETGYRTLVTIVKNQSFYFDLNYRYYFELSAPKTIITAGLDSYSYIAMAIQSANGIYVSYANGRLPFDLKSQQVYSIGFNYKF